MQPTIDPGLVDDISLGSMKMVRSLAEKKHIKIAYTRPRTTGAHRRRAPLNKLLANLLSNAVKFTPEGGAVGLTVTADAAEQLCHLAVWDSGIGIAAADVSRMLQPFTQLDSRLTRQYAGTGLGLALVQRMVNLLGGSVAVQSTLGKGSTFTVTLPWRSPTASDTEPLGRGAYPQRESAAGVVDRPRNWLRRGQLIC